MNLDCGGPYFPNVSTQQPLSTPRALWPTELQITIPHYVYVDLIPIPLLRDALIGVDANEVWNDLMAGEVKIWGSTPWLEMGWEISERFAVKWWFLMTDDILKTTNFWRGVRGEEPLSSLEIKGRFRKIDML